MFIVFLLKLWSWILLLIKVGVFLALGMALLLVSIFTLTFTYCYFRNMIFRAKLPRLLQETHQLICQELKDINNRLSDDNLIDHHTWIAVSNMIELLESEIKVLDETTEVDDTFDLPVLIWNIYLQWEQAIYRKKSKQERLEEDAETNIILRLKLRHALKLSDKERLELAVDHIHREAAVKAKQLSHHLTRYRILRISESLYERESKPPKRLTA